MRFNYVERSIIQGFWLLTLCSFLWAPCESLTRLLAQVKMMHRFNKGLMHTKLLTSGRKLLSLKTWYSAAVWLESWSSVLGAGSECSGCARRQSGRPQRRAAYRQRRLCAQMLRPPRPLCKSSKNGWACFAKIQVSSEIYWRRYASDHSWCVQSRVWLD